MANVTYDAEADAVYITVGHGKAERTKGIGPLLCDLDAEGRIVGIEIRPATKLLAAGHWQKARRPKASAGQRTQAELHRGFIFIKRRLSSPAAGPQTES